MPVLPNINHETLAQAVGISRSRVSHLLNKFKKLGFINYERVELKVNNSLLSVVLND
jgi:predicted transcriptional regulator